MTEYIDRHEAVVVVSRPALTRAELRRFICQIPAADVVEVVRCKDCKYINLADNTIEGKCRCDRNKLWQPVQYRPYKSENDYCSYGERKEDK